MSASTQRIIELRKEAESREKEGVRIYRPHAGQEPIHRSGAVELLCSGGKRCISGDSLVYDPVSYEHRRVDEIDGNFFVYGYSIEQDKVIIVEALKPFTKGEDRFYEVKLSSGKSFKATYSHRVLANGAWSSVEWLARRLRQGEVIYLDSPGELLDHKLESITYIGSETVWDFTVPTTGNYIMAGVVHHNSGKSVSVACEFARRVTGIPICDESGKPFPMIWPQANPEYPRIYWVIGWDTNHLGQTIHRLLFQPGMGGQFRCIQDEVTGKWRAWNRANPIDAKRVKESALTEPLIPDRLIVPDSWEWEDKRGNQFRHVELKNGAKIYAYPSTARNPKQGDAVSGIWIDEDIVYPDHLKEWQDRLTDERGFLLWSVWPHMKNEALLTLIERAEMAALHENPRIERVSLTMTDNPYITQEGKDQALERMGSDEEIARRNRGDLMMDSLSMYPFDSSVHSIKPRNPDLVYEPIRSDAYNKLREIMEMLGGFPDDWTRYLSMDPSHTRTGIHSWVVPPHNVDGVVVGDMMICEWEIVAKRLTAAMIAKEVKDRMLGKRYEAFIMDMRAGRQTHAGRDSNTLMFFAEAFRTAGLMSRQSGYSFLPGCDVPSTRYRAVRDLMEIQPRIGVPSLMIVEGKCPETKKEFTKYRKKREARGTDADSVLDEPANPRLYDCMAAMEYAASHLQRLFMQGKAYVSPDVYKGQGSSAYRHVQDIMRKHENQNENGVVCLGAGNYTSSY